MPLRSPLSTHLSMHRTAQRLLPTLSLAASALVTLAPAFAQPTFPPLPAVQAPPENPITEPKRVLGKILFWDEQLSSDSTMACATCHTMSAGGSDNRRVRRPGPDNQLNTPDDIIASPGVVRQDAFEDYLRDALFGVQPQVTTRTAMSPINAALMPELFWDGRARGQFRDPETNALLIPQGGALESQAVGPPTSSIEMAHDGINWSQITAKLTTARPLALATGHPSDVAAVLTASPRPDYPELFRRAFGDPAITAARIGFAIATYQRTLIADQTPWDRFNAGDVTAMTQNQRTGLQRLIANNCTACHTPPLFSNNTFRNIGVRPPTEDPGRQLVTGLAGDLGRMKTPSLRNVALKNNFMHNGQFTTLGQVFGFYDRGPGAPPQFQQNLDPIFNPPGNVRMPPPDGALVADFLTNALVDPRVRNETFPFDRPTLFAQRPADRPVILVGGTPGSNAITPVIIANTPPMIGNADFKLGLSGALGGASARLIVSTNPPVNGVLTPTHTFDTKITSGAGAGQGVATHHWPLTGIWPANGATLYAQWVIDDAGAAGGEGVARSNIAQIRFWCGTGGCPVPCTADVNGDLAATVQDLFTYLTLYFAADSAADLDGTSGVSTQDLFTFLSAWFAGC